MSLPLVHYIHVFKILHLHHINESHVNALPFTAYKEKDNTFSSYIRKQS